jgi:GT2 family glycosyltransferase
VNAVDRGAGANSVGAVIVHFHREADAATLVADLVTTHQLSDDQIVLVDNGSDAGRLTDELNARARSPIVLSPGNIGYAAAMNLGVGSLPESVDIVVLLTHEVVLSAGAIAHLSTRVSQDPLSVVGPVLLTEDGRVWSAGGELTRFRRLPRHRHHGLPVETLGSPDPACAWLDGAVVVLARDTFTRLGGLDDRYFLYGEDVEFGERARAGGATLSVVSSVTAVQAPNPLIDPFLWTRNPFLYLRRHRHWLAWTLWLASCMFGIVRDAASSRAHRGELSRRASGVWAGLAGRGGPPPPSDPGSV